VQNTICNSSWPLHNKFLKRLLQGCLIIPSAVTPEVVGLLAKLIRNQLFGIINYLPGFISIHNMAWLGVGKRL